MSISNRTVQFNLMDMSSCPQRPHHVLDTQPGTAEVRPFPNVKVVPDDRKRRPQSRRLSLPKLRTPRLPAEAAPRQEEAVGRAPSSCRSSRLALLGAGGWYGYNYWTDGRFMISTDDAYVQADMTFISPKISGYVDQVPVTENQQVKAGDPLLIIDDGDYKIAVAQTEAQIATQSKTLERIDAQTEAAKASLQQAEAQKTVGRGRGRQRRARPGARRAAGQDECRHPGAARRRPDRGRPDQGRRLPAPTRRSPAPQANIGVLEAQHAEAAKHAAHAASSAATRPRAISPSPCCARPMTASSATVSVEQGDLISPGQKLAVDRADGQALHRRQFQGDAACQAGARRKGASLGRRHRPATDFEGTVSSLAPASGAVFSLLPPENATGNFTKVVQRVPVRIDVPADVLKTGRLRAGLSVVVDVDSRTAPAAHRTRRHRTGAAVMATATLTARIGAGQRRRRRPTHGTAPRHRLPGDGVRHVHGDPRHPDRLGLAGRDPGRPERQLRRDLRGCRPPI